MLDGAVLVVFYVLDLTPGTTYADQHRGSPDERESLSSFISSIKSCLYYSVQLNLATTYRSF
jgi:hypothetical protein